VKLSNFETISENKTEGRENDKQELHKGMEPRVVGSQFR
jgi:hypothetical protein